MKTQIFRPSKYSEEEKLIIEAENSMINNFFAENFYIKPDDVSRDKNGLLYVFAKRHDNYCSTYEFHMFTLAYNVKEDYLTAYCIATASLGQLYCNGNLESIMVHPAFANKGLGGLLHQHIENTAINFFSYDKIRLKSLKSYKDFSDNKLSLKQTITTLPEEEAVKYLKDNFYDANRKFYISLGYVPSEIKIQSDNLVNMEKDSLNYVDLKYGIDKPLHNLTKQTMNDISLSHGETSIALSQIDRQDRFNMTQVVSEDICPLTFAPNEQGLRDLYNILTNVKAVPIYEQDIKPNNDYTLNKKTAEGLVTSNRLSEYVMQKGICHSLCNSEQTLTDIYQNTLEKLQNLTK